MQNPKNKWANQTNILIYTGNQLPVTRKQLGRVGKGIKKYKLPVSHEGIMYSTGNTINSTVTSFYDDRW